MSSRLLPFSSPACTFILQRSSVTFSPQESQYNQSLSFLSSISILTLPGLHSAGRIVRGRLLRPQAPTSLYLDSFRLEWREIKSCTAGTKNLEGRESIWPWKFAAVWMSQEWRLRYEVVSIRIVRVLRLLFLRPDIQAETHNSHFCSSTFIIAFDASEGPP